MLKAYASYFASYIITNLKNIDNVERIVLYGSVAKDEATRQSDIDIFFEVKKKTKRFEQEVKELEKKFYESREAALFKSKGIENKLSIKLGKLKEWKELYIGIASTGIIFYGPYEAKELPSGVSHFIIVFWHKIGKNRGSFLNKLYGFKIKDKHYFGLISKFEGTKIGKSCVMFPVQYRKHIFKLLAEHKVEAKTIEVFR